MPDIAGVPYFELEFDKDVKLVHPEQQKAILDALDGDSVPTDLVVMSHGWNNDMGEARQLYGEFFKNYVADRMSDGTIPARRLAIVGVLWPSKKFAEHDLIPGGAASAGNDVAADKVLMEQIGILESVVGKDLSEIRALVPQLKDTKSAREKFSNAVLALIPQDVGAEDDQNLKPSSVAIAVAEDKLLDRLSRPAVTGPAGGGTGGAASIGGGGMKLGLVGGAAGLGDLFSGVKAGAMNLLNVTTYYQMKSRAGAVGESGVNPLLRAIRAKVPGIRIHMIGHSFGARVVTAATAGAEKDAPIGVTSVSLLQAAFSHYAFAENWDGKNGNGLFRRMIAPAGKYVTGPMIITHTHADKAVGVAYAIASRAGRQNASGLGDATDQYGGLGGNGAQKTPGTVDLKINTKGERYAFTAGKVHNVDGNGVIESHGDIRRTEVTHAAADALRTT
ncbi:MAG TPA: hypothetical protein VK636_17935 [Gemmatimonadaceae bacterium]|nr:hypothetical protein [Gemmatimonadaceae bacterium]